MGIGRDLVKDIPTVVGLILALGGLPILALVQIYPSQYEWIAYVWGPVSLTVLGGCILSLVVFWERLPLSTIGLKPPTVGTFVWGLLTVGIQLFLITPLGVYLVSSLGLPNFDVGLAKLRLFPKSILILIGMISGCVEELAYRGYATERLGAMTNRLATGGLLTLVAFAVSHLPFWGWGGVCFTALGGSVFTALYLWRRDLLANMLAHAVLAMIQLSAIG